MPGVRGAGPLLCLIAALQQAPVFRGGIDLVTVDAVVLDRSGTPVPTLDAADFILSAGGRERRVVEAIFINARAPERPPRPAALAAVPAASSNTRQSTGRTIVFVVDVENIISGEGRLAMRDVAVYLDRFSDADKIGLVTLPTGSPRVEPMRDRAAVREALGGIVGASMRLREQEMTFGEAVGIETGDRRSLLAFWKRIVHMGRALPGDKQCLPPEGEIEEVVRVPIVCIDTARRTLERWRFQTRSRVQTLQALVEAMAPLPPPRALVLVAAGLTVDPDTYRNVLGLADAAERARVSIHAMQIEASLTELGPGDTLDSRILDNQIGLAGLADIAAAARGTSSRVQGEATPALSQIDRELSGYYLLSFERDSADRPGERVEIDVRTRTDGLTVIARTAFLVAPAATPASDPKEAVGALLRSPAPVAAVPLDVDAYVLPTSGTGDDARVILAVEAGRDPAAIAAVGYQICDPAGTVVADGFQSPVDAGSLAGGRALLLPAAVLRPGRFVLRLAVVDATGRGGTVQHAFEVGAWPAGAIRLSDLIFGDVSAGGFRPAASMTPGAGALPTRLVIRDDAGRFAGLRARIEVTRASDGTRVFGEEIPTQTTPDPLRRFADVEIPIGAYPAGEYVVTAIVSAGGKDIGRRARAFSK